MINDEIATAGFLVEHFDITQANKLLSSRQKHILTTTIQTERQLLALQDQQKGPLQLNKQIVSRVTLYDLGTKIHLEGSTPILINADMNLSNENLSAYLNTGKISITAREYLQHLSSYTPTAQTLVQATKALPLAGSQNEVKQAQQVQELLLSNNIRNQAIHQLLQSPVEESLKALPYYLEAAKTKTWTGRLTNAAGRISFTKGMYDIIQAARLGDNEGFSLGVGEMSFSLVSQLVEDGVVKMTPSW
jgi:hypothetical protein